MGETTSVREMPRWMGHPAARLAMLALCGASFVYLAPKTGAALDTVVQQAVAGAFALSGFAAWTRRPRWFIGPAMMVFALLWWSNFLEGLAPNPLLFTIATLVDSGSLLVLAYMFFAFPEGRVRGVPAKLAVGWAAVIYASEVALWPFYDPRQFGCGNCGPHTNLVLISGQAGWIHTRDSFLAWGHPILGMAIAIAVVWRLTRSTSVARRVVGPLYVPAAVWAVAWTTGGLIPHLNGTSFKDGDHISQVLYRIWACALLLVPLGFLYGMYRARGRRGHVAELIREIGATPSLSGLERALAKTLGDPGLELGLSAGDQFLQADLQELKLPAPNGGRVATFLRRDDVPLGVIVHDRALLLDDRELLEAVGAAARLAVDNQRLQQEIEMQLDEVHASRARIVAAGDDARRRIERNLHDGAQQRLVALLVALRLAQLQSQTGDGAEVGRTLDDMSEQLDAAIVELRDLARGLHPAVLSEKGLVAALEGLADRATVPVALHNQLRDRLEPAAEAAAYYVVAEALTNASRYSGAERVEIEVGNERGRLIVRVRDDGCGGAAPGTGSGLRGLADRVAAAGGELDVSSPPGQGTTVTASIPVLAGAAHPHVVARAAT